MTLGLTPRYPGEPPAEFTSFVGRRRELDALGRLLRSARLVTVTGPAGVGKTRLALRAIAGMRPEFSDGVCVASLGGLRDPGLLPHTVAACLGLPQQDTRPAADAVAEYLRDRRLLLVLDTCEHVIGACESLVQTVLSQAPGVAVLATSRQPLDVPGEHGFPVPPLPVPEPDAKGDASGDAVELFAQRAAATVPGFAVTAGNQGDVIQLCRRLDGIPLAIELAAVQLRTTSLRALISSLERRFLLLSSRSHVTLPRHQTLYAATQWSHDLCTPAEQLLWARLSVFAGSFGITAAEEVCAGGPLDRADVLPALIGLVDKSVVLRSDDDEGRYWLLDSIRQFGAERLAQSGAQCSTRTKHVAYFLGKAADFSSHAKDSDQLPRFRELRGEHADIRAALGYALGAPGSDLTAARLVADLRPYWEISGLLREGTHWLTKILAKFEDPSAERARLLLTRGVLATLGGELPAAIADLEASAAMGRKYDEQDAWSLGHAYLCLALAFAGRYAEAAAAGAVAEECLNASGHFGGLVSLDIHMGYLHLLSGEADQAIDRCATGLDRLGGGGERWARGYLKVITATAMFMRGETDASAATAREALQMKHELGDTTGTAYCLEALALLASAQHRYERAAWLLGAADTLWERTGKPFAGNESLKDLHEHVTHATRDQLGRDRYEKLFRGGGARELDATVSSAVADVDKFGQAGQRAQGPLTSREREIAVLVAKGLTHSQIGQRLFISRRTVDSHVAHIYAKLGISSSAQLASRLTAAGQPTR